MATYKDIQDDVRASIGKVMKTCWIAHVKEMNGLGPKHSPNRISPTARKHPCPPKYKGAIEASMRKLGMIS